MNKKIVVIPILLIIIFVGLPVLAAALGTTAVTAIPMPVLFGVGVKDISSNFGDPRDGGARAHEGEDIMAVKGTPIVSPTNAVVIRITTNLTSSEGNAVYTANPGGETFVYMHLDRIGEGVVSGLVLGQGSLIGYVGNTGNASGGAAHLHLEIHNSSGVPTDPFPRLTAEFTPEQKISFLTTILEQTSDPTALSQFLVTNFHLVLPATDAGCLPGNNFSTITGHSCSPLTSGTNFDRNLTVGVIGNDVRVLQVWLNARGYVLALSGPGSPGNETTYFGALTRVALAKFQAQVGISPAVGYFGPITRAYLSAHY